MGKNWLSFHTVARTDFLTRDEVEFFADSNNATSLCGIVPLSWG